MDGTPSLVYYTYCMGAKIWLRCAKELCTICGYCWSCNVSLSKVWYGVGIFIYFFTSFLYLTSCITTAVTWLTPLLLLIVSVHLWLLLTYYQYTVMTQYWYLLFLDSSWLSTILWLIMSCLLIVLWLLSKWCYCPCDSYCSCDSLFSNTISASIFGP